MGVRRTDKLIVGVTHILIPYNQRAEKGWRVSLSLKAIAATVVIALVVAGSMTGTTSRLPTPVQLSNRQYLILPGPFHEMSVTSKDNTIMLYLRMLVESLMPKPNVVPSIYKETSEGDDESIATLSKSRGTELQ